MDGPNISRKKCAFTSARNPTSMLRQLSQEQMDVIPALLNAFEEAVWTTEGLTAAFKVACERAETSMREVYRVSYALFMGADRGPRLAPILSNCDREDVLNLIAQSAQS